MRWRHAVEKSLEQRPVLVPHLLPAVPAQQFLDAFPYPHVHDGVALARVDRPLVAHLADIDDVGEQAEQRVLGERRTAVRGSFFRDPALVPPPAAVELTDNGDERAVF